MLRRAIQSTIALVTYCLAAVANPLNGKLDNAEQQTFFFPYRVCIRAMITDAKQLNSEANYPPCLLLHLKIEEVLYGSFPEHTHVKISIQDPDWTLLPEAHISKSKRRTCVLAFDPQVNDSSQTTVVRSADIMPVSRVYAPFPRQRFSVSDFANFKSKLSQIRVSDQRAGLENYLRETWTPKRIADFCRPETRAISFFQELVPQGETWRGNLYTKLECPAGKVTWYANSHDGIPNQCSLRVKSNELGQDYWSLSLTEQIPLKGFSDIDFIKARLAYTLENGLWAYERVHKVRLRIPQPKYAWWTNANLSHAKLLRDKDGHVSAYQIAIPNNGVLTARLDKNSSIRTILIDDKPNYTWGNILREINTNIDRVNQENQPHK